jgi:hypothetical protein
MVTYTLSCSVTLQESVRTDRVSQTVQQKRPTPASRSQRTPVERMTRTSTNRSPQLLVELPCPRCRTQWTSVTLRLATTAFLLCPLCRHTWNVAVAGKPALEAVRIGHPIEDGMS